MTLGRLTDAVADARQSITYADQSGDASRRMDSRARSADALHQSGRRAEAGELFAEAERMQKEMQPGFDLLYSLRGFQLLRLAPGTRRARRLAGPPPWHRRPGRIERAWPKRRCHDLR